MAAAELRCFTTARGVTCAATVGEPRRRRFVPTTTHEQTHVFHKWMMMMYYSLPSPWHVVYDAPVNEHMHPFMETNFLCAQVVCRQLGYGGGTPVAGGTPGKHGEGAGEIWLTNLACTGTILNPQPFILNLDAYITHPKP